MQLSPDDVLRVQGIMGQSDGGDWTVRVGQLLPEGSPLLGDAVVCVSLKDLVRRLPGYLGPAFTVDVVNGCLAYGIAAGRVNENCTLRWREFWARRAAAKTIQRHWRRRRAATRIQAAFRAWCWRRRVLWNPNTPVGRRFALAGFRRLVREDETHT